MQSRTNTKSQLAPTVFQPDTRIGQSEKPQPLHRDSEPTQATNRRSQLVRALVRGQGALSLQSQLRNALKETLGGARVEAREP